ncbi:MAG: Crp/Fnr family transcriptional regulator [Hyphomonas sp.]
MLTGSELRMPRLAIDNTQVGETVPNMALRDILKRDGIVTRHKRGEHIIRTDTRSDRVYYIESGFVALTSLCSSGKRQVLDFESPGAVLMPSSEGGAGCELSVEVLADTVCYMLSASSFRRSVNEDANATEQLANFTNERLRRAYDNLVNIGCRQGNLRVRYLLGRLAEQVGLSQDGLKATIPIRQVDLADAAGVTTVYVNQILKKLEADKSIALHKGNIEILQYDRLIEGGA